MDPASPQPTLTQQQPQSQQQQPQESYLTIRLLMQGKVNITLYLSFTCYLTLIYLFLYFRKLEVL